MTDEERLLFQVALRQALTNHFELRDQQILLLYFQIEQPDDYEGCWPPTYASVGAYVGERLLGEPITEGSVRYRVELGLERLRKLM